MADTKTTPEPGTPIKLIKSNVDSIKLPGIYPDSELKGFKLRVGEAPSFVKSYLLVGKPKGDSQNVFCTIGKHGQPWTPDMARKEAEKLRALLTQGINPNKRRHDELKAQQQQAQLEAAQQVVRDLTLRVGFNEHLGKKQRESTVKGYMKVLNAHLKDWFDKPLIDITQADIIGRFDKIHSQSPSSAAHTMRLLKAIYQTVQITYGEEFPELANINPVKILRHARKDWNSIPPREEFIPDEDLPSFHKAVMDLTSQTAKDYLMVAILTGLRMSEICTLRWKENIDLTRKVITIRREEAKNKQRHMLAMSDYLYKLFLRRWENRDSDFVFPGKSREGCYADPEKSIDQVIAATGVKFSSHSLRRTFATAADAIGYDLRSIQRLLNHKPGSVADRHYIQRHAEKTREPIQRINEHLLTLMQAQETTNENNVISLAVKRA